MIRIQTKPQCFLRLQTYKMKNTEAHHVIPISLSGFDIPENVIHITTNEHKELHNTLNLGYSSIRLYRKRTNSIIFINEYSVREMIKVQELYFKNTPNLKRWLIKKQAESLKAQAEYLIRNYGLKNFELRDKFESELHFQRYMLNAYHTSYLWVVKNRSQ